MDRTVMIDEYMEWSNGQRVVDIDNYVNYLLETCGSKLVLYVGANRGQFINEVLKEHDLDIHCFEPNKEVFAELAGAMKDRPKIVCHNKAVSPKPGKAKLYITEDDTGCSLLKPEERFSGQVKFLTLDKTEEVDTIRLDDFINEEQLFNRFKHVGLLKVDVQGYELGVLESLGKYLDAQYVKFIMLEIHNHSFYHGQPTFANVLGRLQEAGYGLGWLFQYCANSLFMYYADALFVPYEREE